MTDRSGKTIDSFIRDGKLPHARKSQEGKSITWQIPLSDLISSGRLVQRFIDKTDKLPKSGEGRVQIEIERIGQPIIGKESKQQIIDKFSADVESRKLEAKNLKEAELHRQYDFWNR